MPVPAWRLQPMHIAQVVSAICQCSQDFEAADISHCNAAVAFLQVPWPCDG